ncbi:hypothetical protein BBJ28_00025507, partial [Nothophytophthora sp. Chile5]
MASSSRSYATFDRVPQHDEADAEQAHPQAAAWCGSRILLSWVLPLMRQGHMKQLNARDVWPLREPLKTDRVAERFAAPLARHHQSIPRAFISVFGVRFALTGVALLVSMLCNLVGPLALNRVVSALSADDDDDDTSPVATATLWVVLVFSAQILQALSDCYSNLQSEVMVIQCMSVLKTLLYRKALRLSASSRKQKSTGALTNMFTSDCESLVRSASVFHEMWLIPLQILVVSYLLVGVLDLAAFAGIGVIVLMLALNHLVSKRMFSLQREYRRGKDKRMKKVAEAFKAVGIVKLNAWEDPIMARIEVSRQSELHSLLRMRIMTSLSIVLMWGMPVFISIAAFGTFSVVLHRELTPAIVFTSLALFQLIQAPLRMITAIIAMLIQSKVALERVSSFLSMAELDPSSVGTIEDPMAQQYLAKNVIVAVEDGEFAWDNADGSTILKNVNLEVKVGDFLVIHGAVGCGKSSLCSALLGEMEKLKGTVYMGGSVAYCSQQPWIQNMTLRDNILFGLPFEAKKYAKVLDACALLADLEALPARDDTEIGERGVNLSGGQQARIALARACYSDASVYILDSPLSAVDAIVQNEIFHKCLLGLLKHKTILLVTHNPEIVASKHITHAVTVDEIGTLVETHRVDSQPEYEPLVSPLSTDSFALPTFGDSDEATQLSTSTSDGNGSDDALNEEIPLSSPFKEKLFKGESAASGDGSNEEKGRLIEDEERSDGQVGRHVFAAYYYAVGGLPVVSAILLSQM